MFTSFEEVLQRICKELAISDSDRVTYTKDAEGITNFIVERMKGADRNFASASRGLSLTGSYLDGLKIDVPDEFDLHVKLEPFKVKLQLDPERPGFLFLRAAECHRITENGFVNRDLLQEWIRELLEKAIGLELEIHCDSGRSYLLSYHSHKRGYVVAHTIQAEGVVNKQSMSFDLVPAFEFPASEWFLARKLPSEDRTWFAVPQSKAPKTNSYKSSFAVCAPHHEREELKDNFNLKNSLRLIKALRDANGMSHLTSHMLKSVYLMELGNRSNSYWLQSTGFILVDILTCLLNCLENKWLPFHWDTDLNHLDRLKDEEISNYREKVSDAITALKQFQSYGYVTYAEVGKLFRGN